MIKLCQRTASFWPNKFLLYVFARKGAVFESLWIEFMKLLGSMHFDGCGLVKDGCRLSTDAMANTSIKFLRAQTAMKWSLNRS